MKNNKSKLLALCFLGASFSVMTADKHNLIDPQLSQFQNVYNYGEAKVVDGNIEIMSTNNFFFLTKKSYKNFILEAEVLLPNVDEYVNSGVIFRAQLKAKNGAHEAVGYQAEVDPSDRKWSGGLYDQARRAWLHPSHPTRSHPDHHFIKNLLPEWTEDQANAYKPLQWNSYRIECRGSNIKIYLNDVLTTHVIDTKDAEGLVGLQHHGSQAFRETGKSDAIVRFRNVSIKELD